MKLELGDIKMDSDNGIQIGARQSHQVQIVRVVESSPGEILARETPISRSIVVATAMMAVVGLASVFLVFSGRPLWGVMLFAVFQLPTAWFVFTTHSRAAIARDAQMAQDALEQDQHRLLEVFSDTATPRTVSQLCKTLSLTEDQTLELVCSLVESGELEEDVDLETGHFIYAPSTKMIIDPDHQSAAQRFAQTQQRVISKDLK